MLLVFFISFFARIPSQEHQKLMEIKNSFSLQKYNKKNRFAIFIYKNIEIAFETLLKDFS